MNANKATPAKAHDGKVGGVKGDKLTTTCSDGKTHCHTIAKDAKVTCDGKPGKAEDLKAGSVVRVTPCKDDKNLARVIDCEKPVPAAAGKG